jgi:hypothetical protein
MHNTNHPPARIRRRGFKGAIPTERAAAELAPIIEPGYTVWDKGYPQELVVEYEGKVVSLENVHGG